MAIPDFQSIMLPLLNYARDENEHTVRDAIDFLAAEFDLSEEEQKDLLPSGRQATFENRVAWARSYMKQAGLLLSPKRGLLKISERGLSVLKEKPDKINMKYLERFPEYIEFKSRHREKKDEKIEESEQTPEERIESAYQRLRDDLSDEILENVKNMPPSFFEKLIIDLLVKMGYGGTRKDAGKAIGKSGDEGIDGIIKEDKLGLDIIYLQAKRWENPVGRPEIQKFAGALQGQRAKKGVFITTSGFSKEAKDYVSNIESKIVLIDGDLLTQLMIDHNIGVSPISSYEIKRIDTDYFIDI
ncbi:MAG: restriction endonuclease [Pseudomonadota bacterium]